MCEALSWIPSTTRGRKRRGGQGRRERRRRTKEEGRGVGTEGRGGGGEEEMQGEWHCSLAAYGGIGAQRSVLAHVGRINGICRTETVSTFLQMLSLIPELVTEMSP
jgi:hypothetical protein